MLLRVLSFLLCSALDIIDPINAARTVVSEAPSANIPDFVIEYAPVVHLYSGEQFWPCDIQNHLLHTTPHLNFTPLQAESDHPTLRDLDQLNKWAFGRFVYLQSNDNVEDRPTWLAGKKNIPASGYDQHGPLHISEQSSRDRERQSPMAKQGKSDAPAVLVVVDKGHGIVDAFWFFFYSYNLGNLVFNIRFGNHVGDWEHAMVRFRNGKPVAVFCSEHNGGSAYTYAAVEKRGVRPVLYSATGTHAMYATPGRHEYVLPAGLLHDQTDRGPLWDPALNLHTYTYDYVTDNLRASNMTPSSPIEWFYFNGRWGDRSYPLDDARQYEFAGQFHYVSGPLGPRFKRLYRRSVCQSRGPCIIRNHLEDEIVRIWKDKEDDDSVDENGNLERDLDLDDHEL